MRLIRAMCAALPVSVALCAAPASAGQDPSNLAFVDAVGTQQVIDWARRTVGRALTYEYRNLDDLQRFVADVGTTAYIARQEAQLDQTRTTLTRQKVVVTVRVVGVGVRDLRADQAQLLVYWDQTRTRGDVDQTETTGSASIVEVRMVDGKWKLDGVTPV